MTAKTTKAKKTIKFAAAFTELEQITEWFEKEDIDLDDGLKKFERGLELAKVCKDKLKDVENKVKEIQVKFSDLVDDEE